MRTTGIMVYFNIFVASSQIAFQVITPTVMSANTYCQNGNPAFSNLWNKKGAMLIMQVFKFFGGKSNVKFLLSSLSSKCFQ